MSKPSYQDLESEIHQLKKQIQQLRNQNAIDIKELSHRWFQLINHDKLSTNDLLQIMGELTSETGTLSSAFYRYDPENERFQFQLSFPLVDETTRKNSDVENKAYPYISTKLINGQNVVINSLDELPSDGPDKQALAIAKQHSILLIPVLHDGKLQATLSIRSGPAVRDWHESDIEITSIAAHLLFQGLQQLQNNLFNQWFDNSSRALSNVEDMETLEFCLQGLAQILNIDGINLFIPSHKDSSINAACCFPTIAEDELAQDPIDLQHFPWLYRQVTGNKTVIVSDIEQLPSEAKIDMEVLRERKIHSYLFAPLFHNNKVSSLIVLYTVDRKHLWLNREADHVKKALPLLFTAYENLQLHRRQQNSLTTLQLVLETTNTGYGISNLDLSDVFLSSSFATMMGYPADQKMTAEWADKTLLWDDQVRKEKIEIRADVFKTGRTKKHILKARSFDNQAKWLLATFTPNTYRSDGSVETILTGFNDLTEQIQQQEELKKSRIEADQASAAKSDFLARMSHEIRTPMNAIIGMSHLIQDTDLNEKQKEQITHIDQAAQSLLGIINDILDFSKIESGKLELESTDFDLPALLEQVMQVASFHGKNERQELILDIDKNVPQRLKGDPLRITQILTNLLSNAVKFTKQGNICLVVKAREMAANIQLDFTISDQGIGMSKHQMDKLFQPFTQADGTISREFGGTGLGLSIVKLLIELMGSTIEVKSTLNQGSSFHFSLDLQQADNCAEQALELTQLRTLVVDDNPTARAVICSIARSLQLPVEEANGAPQAIEMIHQYNQSPEQQFELVLMDYRMPEVDGLHAAEQIKHDKRLKHIPTIIMVSACDREEVMKHQLSQYLEGFLSKPVSASRLYNSVNHLLYQAPSNNKPITETIDALKGMQVLLVEDNLVNQKVAQGILKKQGIEATIANNGQEAIDLLMQRKKDFQVVLMDIEMPQVDGYQATEFIRSHLNLDIPIIAMTAHAMSTDKAKCLKAGMNDHLHKPIKPDLLYQALASFI